MTHIATSRRSLLLALGVAFSLPRAVLAQTKQSPVLIGWLHLGSRESNTKSFDEFKKGLAALGWTEGSSIAFEDRWADGRHDRLLSLAEDLAARKPTIIVAAPLPAVAAATTAAPKTPVVIATGGDPVAGRLVASLARPGGLITGLTAARADLAEKYVELLLAAAPKLKRIGFLADPNGVGYPLEMAAARRSIERYAVEARFVDAADPQEIDPAISRLAKQRVRALVVLSGAVLAVERRRIVESALAHSWPMIAGNPEFAEEGALLSYGPDSAALYRRAAHYVDQILKGAKPGDLPIEQPTKFDLVVNVKTAKALGITIPSSILLRADRVIE